MSGPDTCTLFVPQNGGYTPIVLRGAHWQEEIVGARGVDSTGLLATKRVARVFVPVGAAVPDGLPALCGACYLARGKVDRLAAAPAALTLMAAAKCDYGSPALRHWELLLQ